MTDIRIIHTKGYIHSFLNESISIKPLSEDVHKRMPIVINSTYDCYSSAIMGIDVIFCYPKDERYITPSKVRHQLDMVAKQVAHPSILVVSDIESYNIKRLIDQRIDFVIIGKQMFVPSLLLDLRKISCKDKDIKEEIPSLAQCMILYQLQVGIISETIAEIADKFNVSYSTANRAVRWLQSKKFVIIGRSKKNVQFCIVGKELWDKSLAYLTSPIDKTIFTNDLPEDVLLSGNIIAEGNPKHKYAISKEKCKNIDVTEDGKYIIEVWKYNPLFLSMDKKKVDLLSLYLSMNGSEYGDMINQVENLFKEK